jgi:8-oxo-dGTP pyrophosphatase MutT (NUDIX family)
MGRTEYWNDPDAPKPNSLVPACGVLAVDEAGRIPAPRHRPVGAADGQDGTRRDPSQRAIRETLEETGVTVAITGILGIYSDPAHIVAYTDGEVRQEYELMFTGRPVAGGPTANDEASDVAWIHHGGATDAVFGGQIGQTSPSA